MSDIGTELNVRIVANEPCWFPGLSGRLADAFWSNPQPIDHADYTTAAWLGESRLPGASVISPHGLSLEPLPHAFEVRFRSAFPETNDVTGVVAAVGAALDQLRPGGADYMVTGLVRAIHVIEALAPGYDVSHSEPSIPFSIFVSVPIGERHGTLRLAESLLHEALHLQLTLLEQHAPLVLETDATGFSPWQQCERPVAGLLHGLYVFAGIDQWLTLLDASPLTSSEDHIYLTRRRAEIAQEIAAVATLADAPGLTPTGRRFARWLLRSHERAWGRLHQCAG
ncbi:HEXXH motif-containing putative peptide modification protein [Sphingobium sp. Sx8-8]|uniref:aKG-HExxH-type peptide beta-hydroxylase n=1 Tax=Sphingobium sp. Sx8-8 TaxID=2933617 RepID=UPI001F5A84C2|nr:HEXXH motif-containing putative peptide modification protein [Sphingobium sp. Sx8-8]